MPLLVALMWPLCLSAPTHAQQQTITAETLREEHVHATIGAIVEELYDRRHPERFWEPTQGRGDGSQFQVGGYTALVTLALLYAGESYQNPVLSEVIDHLKEVELEGTYAVAVRAAVWAMLPPRFQEQLEQDKAWLTEGFSPDAGGWAYYKNPTTTVRDNSLRQFGALGWWEASKRGLRVPREYWEALERGFLQMQHADGGWGYRPHTPHSTGSMTSAGLSALFIIQDFLHARKSLDLDRTERLPHELAIERGLAWIDEHFTVLENPGRDQYFYYYLYGMERVALASGYKYFGGKDWYREGAAELIRRFCDWNPDTGTMTMYEAEYGDNRRRDFRTDELAFGLMFLTRGDGLPVMNKLRDDDVAWNNRPRDVANLTFWLAELTASHLFWQIIDVDAPAEEWLDAPLVYFASHRAIPWVRNINIDVSRYVQQWRAHQRQRAVGGPPPRGDTPALPDVPQLRRIREYLNRGGLMLAIQEGSGRAFADSIETLGRLLYPQYDWRTLDAEHWAYTLHQPVRGTRPRGRVLSNGVRDLIILITDRDMTATFQVRRTSQPAHYDTVSNVYFYASEMNRPRPRLQSITGRRDFLAEDAAPLEGAAVRLVRAMYDGNWNPEPAALEIFADALLELHDLTLNMSSHPLAEIHELRPTPDIVTVAGTSEHQFTLDERQAMQEYVRSGGKILFETVGGRGRFATAAESQLDELFGLSTRPMLRESIITGEEQDGASDCASLDYRPYSLHVLGGIDTTPRLRGMMIDDAPRVLFSREDISQALLDQPVWGVHGYSPRSAQRLLRNILLHAIE